MRPVLPRALHRCAPGVVPLRLQVPLVRVEVRRLQEEVPFVAAEVPQRVLHGEDQENRGGDGGEVQVCQAGDGKELRGQVQGGDV